jgi:lipopolysaccharide export system protein LptA
MKRLFFVCSMMLCMGILQRSYSQTPVSTPAPDTVRILDFKHADRLAYKKVDSTNEIVTAAGKVVFQDGKTLFYADSAIHNKNLRTLEAFGNVHIIDNDTIHIRSQYLIYYIDKRQAYVKKKASMTDGKGLLTSDEIFYDSNLKLGTYNNGGKVVNGSTVLTSKEATYYSELKDVYFKRDVKLKNPGYDITTDSLLYNTQSQVATFITKTLIIDSNKSQITTSDGFYDLKSKVAKFGKRTVIKDKALTVTGEDMDIDDKTGIFIATGNAVLIDTSQGVSVIANKIRANRLNNTFTATEHPLMIIRQDKDSVYLTADTLFAGKLSEFEKQSGIEPMKDTLKSVASINAEDSANRDRYFQGFHHVRIFTDSLQAVSDSLFYSGRDSIFKLFINPIVWASNSQITGDTIYLFTKNKKPDHLYVFENAMVIEKSAENLYNQIKGNTLNGYFDDGYINFMRVRGSAESVYFAKDDKQAFVGMNTAHAEIIDMFFKDKKLDRIVCRNDATGSLYPMNQIPEDKKLLNNFKWQEQKRPKTKFELFEDAPVIKPDVPAGSAVSLKL